MIVLWYRVMADWYVLLNLCLTVKSMNRLITIYEDCLLV